MYYVVSFDHFDYGSLFFVHLDYFITKTCLVICGETTTIDSTAMCDVLLKREFNYLLLWYIACADWLIKTSTIDARVNPPLNYRRFGGTPIYPTYIKYKDCPYFLLLISHFMLWTYQSLKKLVWVSSWGAVTNSGPWTIYIPCIVEKSVKGTRPYCMLRAPVSSWSVELS